MKLNQAIEIAKDCGLDTIGEAIYNIRIHASSLFNYGEAQEEYNELCNDYEEYKNKYKYTLETNINDIKC